MPLATQPNLDPAQFVVAPHTAALDTFKMTNDDGEFVANITESYIDKLIAHMNEREAATGDLSPIVVGHTMTGLPETEQPPVVGFARNWHKGILGATNRPCAFFDAWIYRDKVDLAKQYPRRSCEVWASRYEVDPISLLGATTPARDLGLMKLNREGSLTFYSPGDMNVPDDKKTEVPGSPKETGAAKSEEGKLDQILGLLTQLLTKMDGQAGAPTPAVPGADATAAAGAAVPGAGAGDAAGAGGEMGDQEFEALMRELLGQGAGPAAGDTSRNGDAPTPNDKPEPAKKEEPAKMSRVEQELADLRAEVTRGQVREALVKLQRPDIASPEDTALVEDLVAMPPDARKRQLDRIAKTPQAPGAVEHVMLNRALAGAVVSNDVAVGGKKRITNREEMVRLQRRASGEKKTFEQVAAEEGYDLS